MTNSDFISDDSTYAERREWRESKVIYFTSDLHLGHRGIITMQNRPFQTVDEMNRILFREVHKKIQPSGAKNARLFFMATNKTYVLFVVDNH